MNLVIAEKPSVAQSIAKVIGATLKRDGYLEGSGYLVSWCVGHLIELADPEQYDERFSKWRYEDLPIIPAEWKYLVSEATKKQFQVLKRLMERKDVESLVCATDAGREGELIFRLVYQQTRCKKPFERLWISSMEDAAILEGFANLKPGTEYDALYEAALCRERADWIVGMNATRLFSTLYGQTLNVGRVMTPTLAMLVTREAEIAGFKSEPFYTVAITAGGVTASGERYQDKAEVERVLQKVSGAGTAEVRKNRTTEKKEKAPQLYDLTSLQRDANRMLGYTAQQTLDYVQSLYEKKLCTYPRTDSRFLTEDMEPALPKLAELMKEKFGFKKQMEMNFRQIINNKKVSDHHAIIPTVNVSTADFGELPSGEQKVLTLIVAKLLAGIANPCVVNEMELEFVCEEEVFKAKAKQTVNPGWKEVWEWIVGAFEKKESSGGEEMVKFLAALTEGKSYPVQNSEIKEGKTTSKKHFTEDTLLSAMEHAGAEEMPEDAERKGIGTSATRAATIEKLVRIGFVERKGDKKTKYLIPTHKGTALVTVMPEQIQSPLMTADWEEKLLQIERKEYPADEFMGGIEEMVSDLVKTYKVIEDAEVLMHPVHETIGDCPCCGSIVKEKSKGFFCDSRECGFVLWKENHFFAAIGKRLTKKVAERLLKEGKVKLKGCHSQKTGKDYDATVVFGVGDDKKAKFSMEFK